MTFSRRLSAPRAYTDLASSAKEKNTTDRETCSNGEKLGQGPRAEEEKQASLAAGVSRLGKGADAAARLLSEARKICPGSRSVLNMVSLRLCSSVLVLIVV